MCKWSPSPPLPPFKRLTHRCLVPARREIPRISARGIPSVTTPSKIVSRRERAAAWQLTRRQRETERERRFPHTPDPCHRAPRRASRFSSASSRSGLRVTRPRLVTRKARAHARTRGRRQAADSFRAATAKRHRNRGENAAGPCAFDVVACTPSSRSTNERVFPRVFSHRSTTTTAPIERVISGDPSPPRVIFFSPVERLRKGGRGGCTRVPRGGIISRIRRGGGGRKRCDRRVAIARRGCVLTAASAIHV